MLKKIIALSIHLTILLSISACTHTETDTFDSTQEILQQTVLTHVYSETEHSLPDGYSYVGIVDKTPDSITLQCMSSSSEELLNRIDITLFTDERQPVIVESETKYTLFCSSEDTSYGIWSSFDPETTENRYYLDKILPDGSIETTNDLSTMISGSPIQYFYPQDMVVDNQGNIYISALEHILFLHHDMTYINIIEGIEHFQSFQIEKNGIVHVCYRNTQSTGYYVLCPISPDTGNIENPLSVPSNAKPEGVYLGEGYDIYYLNKEGFFGYNNNEENPEKLMDLENSGLADGIIDAAILSPEHIFVNYMNVSGNHYSIMERANDIDLNTVEIIEIVVLDENKDLVEAVTAYNRKNTGYRVSVINYNDKGGEESLLRDISSNLISPDLYCLPQSDTMRYLVKNDMVIDLYPFLDAETTYTKENLIGAIKNTYTVNEKLIALPIYITIETIIGDKNIVGDSWDVRKMLEIANTQKSDEYLSYNLYREDALSLLLGTNFEESFIDWHDYSFDKELFSDVLNYVISLPLKEDRPKLNQISEKYQGYATGKYLTSIYTYTSISSILGDQVYFSPANISRVGYPTSDGYNGSVITDQTDSFLISKNCSIPNEVWDFIKLNIESSKPLEMAAFYYIPVWKNLFWEAVDSTFEMEFFCNHTGGITAMPYGSIELEPDGSFNGNTGVKTIMTNDIAISFLTWLDNIGTPVTNTGNTKEIKEIITEETSALWSGICTVDQCVDRVYSRVQLWLSEHE